jgi:hypothetical protein
MVVKLLGNYKQHTIPRDETSSKMLDRTLQWLVVVYVRPHCQKRPNTDSITPGALQRTISPSLNPAGRRPGQAHLAKFVVDSFFRCRLDKDKGFNFFVYLNINLSTAPYPYELHVSPTRAEARHSLVLTNEGDRETMLVDFMLYSVRTCSVFGRRKIIILLP